MDKDAGYRNLFLHLFDGGALVHLQGDVERDILQED
jgi:hypothetical protein